jgi:hypothetical protein
VPTIKRRHTAKEDRVEKDIPPSSVCSNGCHVGGVLPVLRLAREYLAETKTREETPKEENTKEVRSKETYHDSRRTESRPQDTIAKRCLPVVTCSSTFQEVKQCATRDAHHLERDIAHRR